MSKLTIGAAVSYIFVLVGLALHVAGFVTKHWMTAEKTADADGSTVTLNIGLWDMQQTFSNGTTSQTDSPIAKKEEQYIMLAICAANAALCLVVLYKAVHICVGLISFVSVAMMLIAAFFVYRNVESEMINIQLTRPQWRNMKLSYSLYLTFAGIVVNVIATVGFLTLLLIREEKKAAESTKEFGVDVASKKRTTEIVQSKSNKTSEISEEHNKSDRMGLATTSKTNPRYENTAHLCVISGTAHAHDNASYDSLQDSVYAGPSGDDNFNHIQIETSRL